MGLGLERYLQGEAAPQGLNAREMFIHIASANTPDFHPKTGEIRKLQTQNGKHVPGVDMVIAADAWFSTLCATATPERRAELLAIFDRVVNEQFERVQRNAKSVRVPVEEDPDSPHTTKRQGSKTERIVADLIAYKATHFTARPTDETIEQGRPADPHVHAHLFIFSMAWAKDKWRKIDDDGLKRFMGIVRHEVSSELVRECENLGYKIDFTEQRNKTIKSFIACFADFQSTKTGKWVMGLDSFFSSNKRRERAFVDAYIKEHMRPPSRAVIDLEMKKSRHHKPLEPEPEMNWEAVIEGAKKQGLDTAHPKFGFAIKRRPLEERLSMLHARITSAGGVLGEADDAVFNQRALDFAVSRCAMGLGLTLAQQDEFKARFLEECILTQDRGADYKHTYTTRRNLRNENNIAKFLADQYGLTLATPTPEAVERAIARVEAEKGIVMSESDRQMIRNACAAGGLYMLEGLAGSGKTTLTLAVVYSYEDSKHLGKPLVEETITISTARLTAIGSGEKLKSTHCDSFLSFKKAVESGRIKYSAKPRVVFIDESVMTDNFRMSEEFIDSVRKIGPIKLVLMGDREQLQCIGPGGWYEDAAKIYPIDTLKTVYRQEDPVDIQMLMDLRNGYAEKTIKSLLERDLIHISEDFAGTMGDVIQKMIEFRLAGESINDVKVVMDGKNSDLDLMIKVYQEWLLSQGELKGEGHLVRSENSDRQWNLHIGEEIGFIDGYYQRRTKTEKKISIPNGTQGRILDIKDGYALIEAKRLKEPTWIPLSAKMCPNYVLQVSKFQGHQARTVLCVPGCGTNYRQVAYSELSRHVKNLMVFLSHEKHGGDNGDIDPLKMLEKRWKDNRRKQSARFHLRILHARRQKEQPFTPSTTPHPKTQAEREKEEELRRRRKKQQEGHGLGISL